MRRLNRDLSPTEERDYGLGSFAGSQKMRSYSDRWKSNQTDQINCHSRLSECQQQGVYHGNRRRSSPSGYRQTEFDYERKFRRAENPSSFAQHLHSSFDDSKLMHYKRFKSPDYECEFVPGQKDQVPQFERRDMHLDKRLSLPSSWRESKTRTVEDAHPSQKHRQRHSRTSPGYEFRKNTRMMPYGRLQSLQGSSPAGLPHGRPPTRTPPFEQTRPLANSYDRLDSQPFSYHDRPETPPVHRQPYLHRSRSPPLPSGLRYDEKFCDASYVPSSNSIQRLSKSDKLLPLTKNREPVDRDNYDSNEYSDVDYRFVDKAHWTADEDLRQRRWESQREHRANVDDDVVMPCGPHGSRDALRQRRNSAELRHTYENHSTPSRSHEPIYQKRSDISQDLNDRLLSMSQQNSERSHPVFEDTINKAARLEELDFKMSRDAGHVDFSSRRHCKKHEIVGSHNIAVSKRNVQPTGRDCSTNRMVDQQCRTPTADTDMRPMHGQEKPLSASKIVLKPDTSRNHPDDVCFDAQNLKPVPVEGAKYRPPCPVKQRKGKKGGSALPSLDMQELTQSRASCGQSKKALSQADGEILRLSTYAHATNGQLKKFSVPLLCDKTTPASTVHGFVAKKLGKVNKLSLRHLKKSLVSNLVTTSNDKQMTKSVMAGNRLLTEKITAGDEKMVQKKIASHIVVKAHVAVPHSSTLTWKKAVDIRSNGDCSQTAVIEALPQISVKPTQNVKTNPQLVSKIANRPMESSSLLDVVSKTKQTLIIEKRRSNSAGLATISVTLGTKTDVRTITLASAGSSVDPQGAVSQPPRRFVLQRPGSVSNSSVLASCGDLRVKKRTWRGTILNVEEVKRPSTEEQSGPLDADTKSPEFENISDVDDAQSDDSCHTELRLNIDEMNDDEFDDDLPKERFDRTRSTRDIEDLNLSHRESQQPIQECVKIEPVASESSKLKETTTAAECVQTECPNELQQRPLSVKEDGLEMVFGKKVMGSKSSAVQSQQNHLTKREGRLNTLSHKGSQRRPVPRDFPLRRVPSSSSRSAEVVRRRSVPGPGMVQRGSRGTAVPRHEFGSRRLSSSSFSQRFNRSSRRGPGARHTGELNWF